jgi:hypothetical protein
MADVHRLWKGVTDTGSLEHVWFMPFHALPFLQKDC